MLLFQSSIPWVQLNHFSPSRRVIDKASGSEQHLRVRVSPSFIVGLWRGGSAVGIYVQECLQTLGVVSDHIAIRTSYQGAPDYARQLHSATPDIQVHGTQYLLDTLSAETSY